MPPRRAALLAVLGVLLVALLVVLAFLVSRAGAAGAPTSAATAAPEAAQALSPAAAPPTATPIPTPTAVPPAATPTPAPTGQAIVSFTVPPTFKCDAAGQANPYVHLAWSTAHTTGVSISIDGPGKFADYPSSGSADLPFACSVAQHTYMLTTRGAGAQATRTVVVRRVT